MSDVSPCDILSVFHDNMARRRGQQRGYLYRKGPSWILRWREDVRTADGQIRRGQFARVIGPARGVGALSRREAERLAWEEILSKLDALNLRPQSLATVEQFVRGKFEPEWVWSLKPSGRKHYGYCLRRILKRFGARPLRDIGHDDVQAFCRELIDAGLSVQTARHMRNAISAIFRHAKTTGFFVGENPALGVRLPPSRPKDKHALRPDQVRSVLAVLRSPAREVATLALATGCNIAELAALRWKHVNLDPEPRAVDGVLLPPRSLLVAEHFYRGQFGSLKTSRRFRILPLASFAVELLEQLRKRPVSTGPDDLVLVGPKGRPISDTHLRKRQLAPAGRKVGLPFPLSWHVFRRSVATWCEAVGMPLADRVAILGHGRALMTLHYTVSDVERRREGIEQVARMLGLDDAGPSTVQ